MLSTTISPYLDAELAYRLERLGAHVPHDPTVERRGPWWPFAHRAVRRPAHRASHAH